MNENATLIQRIAAAADCTDEVVEQALNDYGLNLATPARHHRSLRIDRLRIRGRKAGEVEPGAFDETFRFDLGVTVIAADNFRGKTTILELLTLILRGEPRDLQADVRSWLTQLSLDVHINGHPIGFRLSLEASDVIEGIVLAGTVSDLASSDDAPAAGTTVLCQARGSDNWAEQVNSFMMARLGLEEIQVFNRPRAEDEAGTIKSHGWSTYFSVIYPPAAADKVLLGSTPGDFLPVRLMQVFLDMPEATRAMRVRALFRRLESELKAEQRKGRDANALLARQLEDARAREEAAETRLRELEAAAPAESLHDLSQLAADAGSRLAEARKRAEAARTAFTEAQAARIADEKALNALRESAAASVLFHGLDPQSCPRCETEISRQRRLQEQQTQHCAVCDTVLQAEDDDDYAEREQQALDALTATRAAQKALHAERSRTEDDLAVAQEEFDKIDQRIAQASAAREASERVDVEHALAAAKAVVETLAAMAPKRAEPTTSSRVLAAADQVLDEGIKHASAELYRDLGEAVRDLAFSFGIVELEGIRVKANGQMHVTKGGGATSSFSAQSPGERLRLRYALVVALLRIARTRGIAGHPGLLLLDSLKAEEVQDDHAQTLLEGLVTAAADEPGLQILVTTADRGLAGEVSGVTATIEPRPGRSTLF